MSSEHGADKVVFDPDRRESSRNDEGLQMTASNRIHPHTDLDKIDETRGNVTVERADLAVNERNIDRETHSSQVIYSTRTTLGEVEKLFKGL